MNVETLLTQDKAERMTLQQLLGEAARCQNGIENAANAKSKRRFETRLAIFLAEIAKREGRGA